VELAVEACNELIATCQPAVTMQTPSTQSWRRGEKRPGVAQNEYVAWRVAMDAAPLVSNVAEYWAAESPLFPLMREQALRIVRIRQKIVL
jgi:hypothetical protein